MPTGIQLQPPPRRQRDDYDRREQLAQAMMMQATDASPKGHWLAAVAQALQGYMGGRMARQAGNDRQDAATQQVKAQNSERNALVEALTGQFRDPNAPAAHEVPIPGAFGTSPMQELPQMDNRPQMPGFAQALLNSGSPGAQNLAIQHLGQVLMGGGGDSFTLAPGAARYDARGNVIAERPASQSNSTRTAAPGSYVLDSAGNIVRQLPERPQQAPEPNARERQISDIMDTHGVSRVDASNIVDGIVRLTTDDNGNRVLTNIRTGESRLSNLVDAPQTQPRPEVSTFTLEDLSFDPGEGTGFSSTGQQAINATIGQLPGVPEFEGPEVAAQQLRIVERDAIRALASSGRPPVVEQERILAALPRPSEWLENPNVARAKMISFLDLMGMQYVDDLRYRNDPTNPASQREEAARRSREIEAIMRRVLNPDAAERFLRETGGSAGPYRNDAPEDISAILQRYGVTGGN